ncbi:MAG: tRNA-dihydrouridine synthase family protein [Nanoarchaeota archaeon]|nr:tRNA-dihydrouridine synthase family protein [Nanoarchaeota archaeon]
MEKIDNRIFLAPMEGVNDIGFRILCKRGGAGLTWTGMINPLSKEKLILDDKPILQLFCNNEKGIEKFMKKYDKKVSGWDFNLGCPVKRAQGCGVGAFLKDLKIIEKILKVMRKNTKKLLFVKIRKSSYATKILKIAEKNNLDGIIIHGRTAKQGYSGESDVKWCESFKKKSSIPVVYSGDVGVRDFNFGLYNNPTNSRPHSPRNPIQNPKPTPPFNRVANPTISPLVKSLAHPFNGIVNLKSDLIKNLLLTFDAVMIGRAAMGNPGIFSELTKTKTIPHNKPSQLASTLVGRFSSPRVNARPPFIKGLLINSLNSKLIVNKTNFNFSDYLKLALKYKLKFNQIRQQAMWFSKGKNGSKKLREKISRCKDISELKKIKM